MVQQGINIREEFKDLVKDFCTKNNLEWSENIYESTTGGVIGEPENVIKLWGFINELEEDRIEYRKRKGFLWRIFN